MNQMVTDAPSNHDDSMMTEHMAAMKLLDPSDASHVAIKSGNWSDPSTWAGGKVPGEGADVHIPEGLSIRYDSTSDASLHFVRVDGALNWATNIDTRMLVDTVIGTETSSLTIGTATNPMKASVDAQIIFADNGAINKSVDPEQISRGFIAHGEIAVHGEAKEAFLAVADAPQAGDTTLKLAGDMTGWSVGDKLVVMGVEQNGENAQGQLLTQDEERTITAIRSDGTIVLDQALSYDHEPPAGYDFDVYVGNQTRNVTFSSENPDGVRGHVMVMHADGADIRYAAFDDLGRTDVSELRGTEDNPNGRYPLHLHRTGVDGDAELSVLVGNAVSGGPGWGIVQHESYAAVDHNFVYNVQGAGIVSETGNETGQWIGNFVTSIYGDGDKFDHVTDELDGQFGHAGVAYENQSRLIIQQDNVAAGSKYAWVFRSSEIFERDGSDEIALDRDSVQFDPDPTGKQILGEEAQIMGFIGNEAIAVDVAFDSGHRVGITQETDLQSQIFDFTVWNSSRAIDLMNYTGNYVIKDSTFVNGFQAVFLPSKHEGTNLINVTIDGFDEGIVNGGYNSDGVLVDVVIKDTKTQFITRDGKPMTILDGSKLTMLDAPIVKIDPGSDLLMEKGSGDELMIKGTITDSAGTYGFAQNRWIDQPHSISDGLTVRFNEPKFFTYEEAFAYHGTMQQADGSWVMPVVFWVSDRVTGEPHAVVVDIDVKGFDQALLEKYQIDEVTIPDTTIAILDTRSHVGSGQPDVPAGSGEVVVQPEPTAPVPVEPADDPDEDPTAPVPPVDGGAVTTPNPVDISDGQSAFAKDGTYTFDGATGAVINLAHTADLEIESGTVSVTFNAWYTDKYRGIISKDADGHGDGGHFSAAVRNGALEVELQNETDSRKFTLDGIQARQDYDLDIQFGANGVIVSVDGKVIGEDANFALSLADNTENLQVGALGKWSDAGGDDFSALFKGEISDVSIVSTQGPSPTAPATPNTDPEPAPEPIIVVIPEPSKSGSVLYSVDQLELDGQQSSIVNMAHDTKFEQDNAHVSLTFNAAYTDKQRGIFSKDADGLGDGGHVSAAINKGTFELRMQSVDGEKLFRAYGIEANKDYDLDFGFSENGVWATLDNVLIGRDDNFIMSWEENTEFLQVGALGRWSDAGSDEAHALFKGEISDLVIAVDETDVFLF